MKFTRKSYLVCVIVILGLLCWNLSRTIQYWEKRDAVSEAFVKGENKEELIEENTIQVNSHTLSKLQEEYLNKTKYPIFQTTEEVEFPTVSNGISRIPHIIHQIYTTESVPDNFILPMQSFVQQNPTWQYRFWTYESGRQLLAKYHPYLLSAYDIFGNDVKKSDLLRYALLYEFGGVYSDVDVLNIRPLDIATKKYACIIPTETFDHSTILNNKLIWLNTAVLLCRPKHPFFKLLLIDLQFVDFTIHAVFSTGPGFITATYLKYNKIIESDLSKPKIDNDTNSPFFYKGERREDDDDGLYIPNSQYFMDTVDPLIVDENGNLIYCVDGRELPYLAKRGCAEFEHRRKVRMNRKFTFTVHYWFHLWAYSGYQKLSMNYINIKHVIPKCILYEGVL